MHALVAPFWIFVEDPMKISSGFSFLILCPINSSCLGQPRLSFITLPQVVCWVSQMFLTLCHGLETLRAVMGDNHGLTLFVSHDSGIIVLHCVIPSVLRNILSCILSSIFSFQLERVWDKSPVYLSKVLSTLMKFPKIFELTQEFDLSGHDMMLINS